MSDGETLTIRGLAELENRTAECHHLRTLDAELFAALRETTAEAIEHRKNIIEARDADFRGIADPRFSSTYSAEIARFDALIERARAAIAKATGTAP